MPVWPDTTLMSRHGVSKLEYNWAGLTSLMPRSVSTRVIGSDISMQFLNKEQVDRIVMDRGEISRILTRMSCFKSKRQTFVVMFSPAILGRHNYQLGAGGRDCALSHWFYQTTPAQSGSGTVLESHVVHVDDGGTIFGDHVHSGISCDLTAEPAPFEA